MRKLPRDLVLILRTEAKNQRTPPIDYVIAEDGGRMVHRPEPDIAMAELLEEAATTLEAQAAELAWKRNQVAAEETRASDAEAALAEARKALEPFAEIAGEPWADENGWTNAACQNDRICDWFGPSAFRTARRALGGRSDG